MRYLILLIGLLPLHASAQGWRRRHVNGFDFGIQFMANYMRLTVRHGTNPERYHFSLA